MPRLLNDWLASYLNFTEATEAPTYIHYWTGVSAIAAILGRNVWFPLDTFRWYANHYIILVGPPDVISKSTTMKIGMDLVKAVNGFEMGPNSCTWQALVKYMEEHEQDREFTPGKITKVAPCTITVSELGNFLKTNDGEMLDMMISLWDGDTINKMLIKEGGSVFIERPLLNFNGCTTPSWIRRSIPLDMLEGGLLSRMILVYANKKAKLVPYPNKGNVTGYALKKAQLVADLETIGKLRGAFKLSPDAEKFGSDWYIKTFGKDLSDDVGSRDLITRKQSHIHKLAMVISASRRDTLVIEKQDLSDALDQINMLSDYRRIVLQEVGKTTQSSLADDFIHYIATHGSVPTATAYQEFHSKFPSNLEFQNMLQGAVSAGFIEQRKSPSSQQMMLKSLRDV